MAYYTGISITETITDNILCRNLLAGGTIVLYCYAYCDIFYGEMVIGTYFKMKTILGIGLGFNRLSTLLICLVSHE